MHAELDTTTYPTGVRIPDAQMNALRDTGTLRRQDWHPERNYQGVGLTSLVRRRNARTLLEVATANVVAVIQRGATEHAQGCGGEPGGGGAVVRSATRPRPGCGQAATAVVDAGTASSMPNRADDAEESAALSWSTRASRPLTDLGDDLVASELLPALGKTSTGRTVTSSPWDKRRAVLHRTVEFARSSGWIEVNPLTGRRLVARHSGPVAVDPRVVVNPAQARQRSPR